MIHRRHGAMRFEKLLWITRSTPKREGLYLINTTLPRESGIDACISSRITTGIQVVRDYQINYNWYNEPFAVFKVKELYLDMHGLIFETSVWLLAESTRLLSLPHWILDLLLGVKWMNRPANLPKSAAEALDWSWLAVQFNRPANPPKSNPQRFGLEWLAVQFKWLPLMSVSPICH